VKTLNRYYI